MLFTCLFVFSVLYNLLSSYSLHLAPQPTIALMSNAKMYKFNYFYHCIVLMVSLLLV